MAEEFKRDASGHWVRVPATHVPRYPELLAQQPHRKNYKAGRGKHGHPKGPRAPHPNNLPRRR